MSELHHGGCHCGNYRKAIGAQAVVWVLMKKDAFPPKWDAFDDEKLTWISKVSEE